MNKNKLPGAKEQKSVMKRLMQKSFDFRFFDLKGEFNRSGLISATVMVVILTIAALTWTELTPLDALIAGFIATILYYLLSVIHQYGHYTAGKMLGYPAVKIKAFFVIMMIRYPRDEPELAPMIHIRRALGGPAASLLVTLVMLIVAVLFWRVGGMLRFLIGWVLFANTLVFLLGALLPPINLPFFQNDGGTILYWMRQRDAA